MRLRKRQTPSERLRRRVADSVAQVEIPQRVAVTADRLVDRMQHAASDARGTLGDIELPRRHRSNRRGSNRRGGLLAIGLLAVAGLAIGVAWWRRHHRDEEFARLAGTPDEPLAPPAAPSSPDGMTAPVEANSNQSNHEREPIAHAPAHTPAMASAEVPDQAPASPLNRGTQRTEARLASRSLLDSSTSLPRFDAIKPPAPRYDPPGPTYGKFAP